ncbi:MAG: DUF5057 domain-containing protein [Clostridiales bacterium]|nr:DUF5057 domain-containing protein [Clostridiales bacterium]
MKNMSKPKKILLTAVSFLLIVSMTVTLFGNIDRASAASSLTHIEEIKSSYAGSTFKVLEIAPESDAGSIGYYIKGEEPVANWRETLAGIANQSVRKVYATRLWSALVEKELLTIGASNTDETPMYSSGNYDEQYPWVNQYSANPLTETLELNKVEKINAVNGVMSPGVYTVLGEKGTGKYIRPYLDAKQETKFKFYIIDGYDSSGNAEYKEVTLSYPVEGGDEVLVKDGSKTVTEGTVCIKFNDDETDTYYQIGSIEQKTISETEFKYFLLKLDDAVYYRQEISEGERRYLELNAWNSTPAGTVMYIAKKYPQEEYDYDVVKKFRLADTTGSSYYSFDGFMSGLGATIEKDNYKTTRILMPDNKRETVTVFGTTEKNWEWAKAYWQDTTGPKKGKEQYFDMNKVYGNAADFYSIPVSSEDDPASDHTYYLSFRISDLQPGFRAQVSVIPYSSAGKVVGYTPNYSKQYYLASRYFTTNGAHSIEFNVPNGVGTDIAYVQVRYDVNSIKARATFSEIKMSRYDSNYFNYDKWVSLPIQTTQFDNSGNEITKQSVRRMNTVTTDDAHIAVTVKMKNASKMYTNYATGADISNFYMMDCEPNTKYTISYHVESSMDTGGINILNLYGYGRHYYEKIDGDKTYKLLNGGVNETKLPGTYSLTFVTDSDIYHFGISFGARSKNGKAITHTAVYSNLSITKAGDFENTETPTHVQNIDHFTYGNVVELVGDNLFDLGTWSLNAKSSAKAPYNSAKNLSESGYNQSSVENDLSRQTITVRTGVNAGNIFTGEYSGSGSRDGYYFIQLPENKDTDSLRYRVSYYVENSLAGNSSQVRLTFFDNNFAPITVSVPNIDNNGTESKTSYTRKSNGSGNQSFDVTLPNECRYIQLAFGGRDGGIVANEQIAIFSNIQVQPYNVNAFFYDLKWTSDVKYAGNVHDDGKLYLSDTSSILADGYWNEKIANPSAPKQKIVYYTMENADGAVPSLKIVTDYTSAALKNKDIYVKTDYVEKGVIGSVGFSLSVDTYYTKTVVDGEDKYTAIDDLNTLDENEVIYYRTKNSGGEGYTYSALGKKNDTVVKDTVYWYGDGNDKRMVTKTSDLHYGDTVYTYNSVTDEYEADGTIGARNFVLEGSVVDGVMQEGGEQYYLLENNEYVKITDWRTVECGTTVYAYCYDEAMYKRVANDDEDAGYIYEYVGRVVVDYAYQGTYGEDGFTPDIRFNTEGNQIVLEDGELYYIYEDESYRPVVASDNLNAGAALFTLDKRFNAASGSGFLDSSTVYYYANINYDNITPVSASFDDEHRYYVGENSFSVAEDWEIPFFVEDGIDYYIYVGAGNGIYKYFNTDVGDERATINTVATQVVFYNGGIENNNWFLRHVFDYDIDGTDYTKLVNYTSGGNEYEMMNVTVDTVTTTFLNTKKKKDVDAFVSGFDLVVFTGGTSVFEDAPTFTDDLSKDAYDVLKEFIITYETPTVVDIALTAIDYRDSGGGRFVYLKSLVNDVGGGRNYGGVEKFIYRYSGTALPNVQHTNSTIANKLFADELQGQHSSAAGAYNEVYQDIQLEKESKPTLFDKVTEATCIRYIINYAGRAVEFNKTELRVLDIEPYTQAPAEYISGSLSMLTSVGNYTYYNPYYYYDSFIGDIFDWNLYSELGEYRTETFNYASGLTVEMVKEWFPDGRLQYVKSKKTLNDGTVEKEYADTEITITRMSMSEFNGSNLNLVENFDLVYIGSSLTNMNYRLYGEDEADERFEKDEEGYYINREGNRIVWKGKEINELPVSDPDKLINREYRDLFVQLVKRPDYLKTLIPDYNEYYMDGMYYTNIGDIYYARNGVDSTLHRNATRLGGLLADDYNFNSGVGKNLWEIKADDDTLHTLPFLDLRSGGNDITANKKAQLDEFSAAGYPVVLSDALCENDWQGTLECTLEAKIEKGSYREGGFLGIGATKYDGKVTFTAKYTGDALPAGVQPHYTWYVDGKAIKETGKNDYSFEDYQANISYREADSKCDGLESQFVFGVNCDGDAYDDYKNKTGDNAYSYYGKTYRVEITSFEFKSAKYTSLVKFSHPKSNTLTFAPNELTFTSVVSHPTGSTAAAKISTTYTDTNGGQLVDLQPYSIGNGNSRAPLADSNYNVSFGSGSNEKDVYYYDVNENYQVAVDKDGLVVKEWEIKDGVAVKKGAAVSDDNRVYFPYSGLHANYQWKNRNWYSFGGNLWGATGWSSSKYVESTTYKYEDGVTDLTMQLEKSRDYIAICFDFYCDLFEQINMFDAGLLNSKAVSDSVGKGKTDRETRNILFPYFPTRSGSPGASGAAVLALSEDRIDNSSLLFETLDAKINAKMSNVMSTSGITVTEGRTSNTEKKLKNLVNASKVYFESNQIVGDNVVTTDNTLYEYKFKITNHSGHSNDPYDYNVYVDSNADGNFSESEIQPKSTVCGVFEGDTATAPEQSLQLSGGNNNSVNHEYTLRMNLEARQLYSWKLEVINSNNSSVHNSVRGFVYSVNGDAADLTPQREISVLQVLPMGTVPTQEGWLGLPIATTSYNLTNAVMNTASYNTSSICSVFLRDIFASNELYGLKRVINDDPCQPGKKVITFMIQYDRVLRKQNYDTGKNPDIVINIYQKSVSEFCNKDNKSNIDEEREMGNLTRAECLALLKNLNGNLYEMRVSKNGAITKADKQKDFDMLIVGFGDSYCNGVSEQLSQAISDFIDTGKHVLYTHDATSYANNFYANNRQAEGYYMNLYVRDRVGLDPYGITTGILSRSDLNRSEAGVGKDDSPAKYGYTDDMYSGAVPFEYYDTTPVVYQYYSTSQGAYVQGKDKNGNVISGVNKHLANVKKGSDDKWTVTHVSQKLEDDHGQPVGSAQRDGDSEKYGVYVYYDTTSQGDGTGEYQYWHIGYNQNNAFIFYESDATEVQGMTQGYDSEGRALSTANYHAAVAKYEDGKWVVDATYTYRGSGKWKSDEGEADINTSSFDLAPSSPANGFKVYGAYCYYTVDKTGKGQWNVGFDKDGNVIVYGKTNGYPIIETGESTRIANIDYFTNKGYKIAYLPDSGKAENAFQTQAYTRYAMERMRREAPSTSIFSSNFWKKFSRTWWRELRNLKEMIENQLSPTAGSITDTSQAPLYTDKITQVNSGRITTYPYNLNTAGRGVSGVSNPTTSLDYIDGFVSNENKNLSYVGKQTDLTVNMTHEQYYSLDLTGVQNADGTFTNDFATVWYCLGGTRDNLQGDTQAGGMSERRTQGWFSRWWDGNKVPDMPRYAYEDNIRNDCADAYYLYTYKNVTYTGAGHTNNMTLSEAMLFINTIVASAEATIDGNVASIEALDSDTSEQIRYYLAQYSEKEVDTAATPLESRDSDDFTFDLHLTNVQGDVIVKPYYYNDLANDSTVTVEPSGESGEAQVVYRYVAISGSSINWSSNPVVTMKMNGKDTYLFLAKSRSPLPTYKGKPVYYSVSGNDSKLTGYMEFETDQVYRFISTAHSETNAINGIKTMGYVRTNATLSASALMITNGYYLRSRYVYKNGVFGDDCGLPGGEYTEANGYYHIYGEFKGTNANNQYYEKRAIEVTTQPTQVEPGTPVMTDNNTYLPTIYIKQNYQVTVYDEDLKPVTVKFYDEGSVRIITEVDGTATYKKPGESETKRFMKSGDSEVEVNVSYIEGKYRQYPGAAVTENWFKKLTGLAVTEYLIKNYCVPHIYEIKGFEGSSEVTLDIFRDKETDKLMLYRKNGTVLTTPQVFNPAAYKVTNGGDSMTEEYYEAHKAESDDDLYKIILNSYAGQVVYFRADSATGTDKGKGIPYSVRFVKMNMKALG